MITWPSAGQWLSVCLVSAVCCGEVGLLTLKSLRSVRLKQLSSWKVGEHLVSSSRFFFFTSQKSATWRRQGWIREETSLTEGFTRLQLIFLHLWWCFDFVSTSHVCRKPWNLTASCPAAPQRMNPSDVNDLDFWPSTTGSLAACYWPPVIMGQFLNIYIKHWWDFFPCAAGKQTFSFCHQTTSIRLTSAVKDVIKDSVCNQGQIDLRCVWAAHRSLHSAELKSTSRLFLHLPSSSSLHLLCVILLFPNTTSSWWSKQYLTFCNIPKVCVYHQNQSPSSTCHLSASSQLFQLEVFLFRLKAAGLMKGKKRIFGRSKKWKWSTSDDWGPDWLLLQKTSEWQLWFECCFLVHTECLSSQDFKITSSVFSCWALRAWWIQHSRLHIKHSGWKRCRLLWLYLQSVWIESAVT